MSRSELSDKRTLLGRACCFVLMAITMQPAGANQDDLARRASWEVNNGARVVENCEAWLSTQETIDEDKRRQLIESLTQAAEESPASTTRALLRSLAEVDARISELLEICSRPRSATELTNVVVVEDGTLPDWVRSNLRLHYGTWLANQALYDEAQEQLALVGLDDVAEPATLLFYQALVHHRKLEKSECLKAIDKLMENEATIPRRYSAVAKLMQADIEPLKPDSLDEISRLMDSIKVRLGHGRAGTRVRKEEDDVIAKLDKLIKKLEEQAQQSVVKFVVFKRWLSAQSTDAGKYSGRRDGARKRGSSRIGSGHQLGRPSAERA